MQGEPPSDDKAALAELRERERELEAELAAVHASIGALSAQVNAAREADWDRPISIAEPPPGAPQPRAVHPAAYLQPLSPYDPLRLKWDLGSGLEARRPKAVSHRDTPTNAVLHLSGRMPEGKPWETHIPFSEMAQEDGIVIGRERNVPNLILLDHACVSRMHVRLELTDDGLVVTDLGSMNGTSVNERELKRGDYRVPLRHGDVLTVGTIPLLTEIIR